MSWLAVKPAGLSRAAMCLRPWDMAPVGEIERPIVTIGKTSTVRIRFMLVVTCERVVNTVRNVDVVIVDPCRTGIVMLHVLMRRRRWTIHLF